MARLGEELTVLREDVTALKVSDAKQTVILEGIRTDLSDHMRRTELLEKFTEKWAGVWTGLGVLAVITGIAASIAGVLGAFR